MAIEVFNRKENKFILEHSQYEEIQKHLNENMELDHYNKSGGFYTISNLYYDTRDNYLIRSSMAKPSYKEKLRIRAYGIPKNEDKVFLEVKKKFSGIVNKRRTKVRLQQAYNFLSSGIQPGLKEYMNSQVLKEIEYMLKIYEVEPKLYLAYDRKAYFGTRDSDLRITFDTNIRSRRYDLKLEYGDYGESLLENGQWLMEIKVEKNLPFWLARLLSEQKVYSRSFSKYGKEYERMILRERKEEGATQKCLNQYLETYQIHPQLVHQYL